MNDGGGFLSERHILRGMPFFFEKFLKNVSETDKKTSRFCAKDAGLLMRIFINRLHFHTVRHFDAGIKSKMQILIQNSMSVSDMFL